VLPLLLALLYRSAIPVGFMPVLDADGRLTIELCSGVATTSQARGHEHHDHQQGQGHGKGAGAHSLCPFAASAGAAPLPDGPTASVVVQEALFIAVSGPASISLPTILRSQQSRAPPSCGVIQLP
jgi:Protein of unknown function (DUF2946)